MFVYFFQIFIAILILGTIEGIRQNISNGTFIENKYSNSRVIVAYDNVGPLMCIKDCLLDKGCTAVNFNRSQLECELLDYIHGDSITDNNGSFYTEINGWKKEADGCTPNPCDDGKRCVTAMFNNYVCMEIEAPCDVNLCQYGVCRNKVNQYICECHTGYYGDYCERTPCTNVNCNNGYCSIQGSGYKCFCNTDYHGSHCEYTCINLNCYFGGTCSVSDSGWTCHCPSTHYGSFCELVNPCYGINCNNGYCIPSGSSYYCSCVGCWDHDSASLCLRYIC